jgi:hypothetical protein
MAPAMIAPVIWPTPAAIEASPVGKSIRARPPRTASQPRTVTSHRSSVRPAIVNAHDGKPSDEQEDA